jgi:hypothetical protein
VRVGRMTSGGDARVISEEVAQAMDIKSDESAMGAIMHINYLIWT